MKLSDVMSAMRLASYAEVGLVLFLLAFLLVVVDLLRKPNELEQARFIPLTDDSGRSASKDLR
jgi:hypothetical protein